MSNPYIVWLRDPTTIPSVSVTVNVTGVSATSAVGTVTVSGDANRTQTGVSATSATGSVTVGGDSNRTQTGVGATSAIGSVTTSGDSNSTQTGVSGTGSTGSVSTAGDAGVGSTGVGCTGSTGTCSSSGESNTICSGVSASSAIGTVIVTTDSAVTTATHRSRRNVRFHPLRDTEVFARGVGAKAETSFVSVQTQQRGKPLPTTFVRAGGSEARSASGKISISTDTLVKTIGARALSFTTRARIGAGVSIDISCSDALASTGAVEATAESVADVYGEWSRGSAGSARVKTVKNPTDEELIALIVAARRHRKR